MRSPSLVVSAPQLSGPASAVVMSSPCGRPSGCASCQGRPLAVHDWDSVLYEPEVVIAGQAAAVFQDARTGDGASAGQSEAFLEAYQRARERAFSKAELQLCWAAGLWVLAFNAKKFHLDGFDVLGGPKQNRG
jgi:hypothetical protein